MSDDGVKTCTKCGETKAVSEYDKLADGTHTQCKHCRSAHYAAYRKRRSLQDRTCKTCKIHKPAGDFYEGPRCKECVKIDREARSARLAQQDRKCGACGTHKIASFFHRGQTVCKSCAKSKQALDKYGVLAGGRERLLELQGHGCAICGTDEPGCKYGWAVDHSHVKGNVRGMLCKLCNTGLGAIGDEYEIAIQRAERMLAYLKRAHDCTHDPEVIEMGGGYCVICIGGPLE